MGSWTGWQASDHSRDLKTNKKAEGGYFHCLVAPAELSNSDADRNHVHCKWPLNKSKRYEYHNAIIASIKVDGNYAINRGQMINKINNCTGLNLTA